MNNKECFICNEIKDIKYFKKYKLFDGTQKTVRNCLACSSLKRKMYNSFLRKQNPKCNHCNTNLNSENWYKSHQKYHTYSCISCHKNLDSQSFKKHKNAKLKKYNISYDDYMKLFNDQNGKCKICKKEENSKTKKLYHNSTLSMAVDHCHKTNKVRGLLCMKCNRGLGLFEDSIENLSSAIEYLEESAN